MTDEPACHGNDASLKSVDCLAYRHEEAVKLLLFVDNVYRLCASPRNHTVLNFSSRFARLLRERALSLSETEERSEEEDKELDNANKNALRFARRVIDNTGESYLQFYLVLLNEKNPYGMCSTCRTAKFM